MAFADCQSAHDATGSPIAASGVDSPFCCWLVMAGTGHGRFVGEQAEVELSDHNALGNWTLLTCNSFRDATHCPSFTSIVDSPFRCWLVMEGRRPVCKLELRQAEGELFGRNALGNWTLLTANCFAMPITAKISHRLPIPRCVVGGLVMEPGVEGRRCGCKQREVVRPQRVGELDFADCQQLCDARSRPILRTTCRIPVLLLVGDGGVELFISGRRVSRPPAQPRKHEGDLPCSSVSQLLMPAASQRSHL